MRNTISIQIRVGPVMHSINWDITDVMGRDLNIPEDPNTAEFACMKVIATGDIRRTCDHLSYLMAKYLVELKHKGKSNDRDRTAAQRE